VNESREDNKRLNQKPSRAQAAKEEKESLTRETPREEKKAHHKQYLKASCSRRTPS
jgi:hypothetical protein